MVYSLLIDMEVLDFLQKLPSSSRKLAFDHLRKIQDFPTNFSDYTHKDDAGRRLDVSVYSKYAIYYWIDFGDRQVKVLKITHAD